MKILKKNLMVKLYFSIALTFLISSMYSQTQHLVDPMITDNSITSPTNNHFAYTNQSLFQKNKLFLFFPGTSAVPYNYLQILKTAANLGYHSIGLTYPNAEQVNTLCAPFNDTTCHGRVRYEVFDGIDRSNEIVVSPSNSIKNRTIKLLQHLNSQFPTENWGQYFIGDSILWHKIIVGGHSQGGGHAGFISKIKLVDRVVMFAAMDWVNLAGRNADWITWNGPTPKSKYFGFIHPQDELVNYTLIQTTWNNYGMYNFGNQTLTDGFTSPYGNSNTLYTNLAPDNDPTKFHGSVVSDAYTPMNGIIPKHKPVWEYMIDSPIVAILETDNSIEFELYPNPAQNQITISSEKLIYKMCLFDALGNILPVSFSMNEFRQNVSIQNLPAGIYFIHLTIENEQIMHRFVKL
jgi:hypothetical protein